MKRSTLICLVLALALAAMPLLAGCAAKDNRVVARVGDREITMQQFTNAYRNNEAYAVYYGYDLSTDEGLADFQDYILDLLVNSEMLLYQADQAGITLTEEEVAEAETTGKESYDAFYDQFLQAAENAGASDVRAYANKLLTDALVDNGMTVSEVKQSYLDSARDNMIIEKLQNQILDEVQPTAEELRAMYDEELAEQQELFDETPSSYFSYATSAAYGYSCIPLYVPEGFFRVRQILVADEETANEVLEKLEAGEDFETLLEEYNTDPGMESEAYANGYLVGEGANFITEFLDAALALENDGDVSPAVQSSEGYHIIKRVSTEPSRVISYEEQQESLDAYFTNVLKNEHYNEVLNGWLETEGLVTRDESLYRTVGK